MACISCGKGFITEQENLEEQIMEFVDHLVKRNYRVFYKFCSNVLCNWNDRRRELISEKKFHIKKD